MPVTAPSKSSLRQGLGEVSINSTQRLDRPLRASLCHARSDRGPVHALPAGARLTTLAPGASAGEDGVDILPAGYAWLDKEKLLYGQD